MSPVRLLLAIVLLWVDVAAAQDEPGDTVAGEKLARKVCASCHIVSDQPVADPGFGAPSFLEVTADPAVTEMSLRVFLQTPHANMPDLILSPEEIDDVISYLLSLRKG
jgi:mono/diheme cytochrome c family protein